MLGMLGDAQAGPPQASSAVIDQVDALTTAQDPYAWLIETHYPGGIVINPELARDPDVACDVLDLGRKADGTEAKLVYKRGVVGGLDEGQQGLFCMKREVHEASPAQRERILAFQHAAEVCSTIGSLEDGEQGERERVSCLSRELHLEPEPAP